MADIKPFDSENKTSIFAAVKNGETRYPVPYFKWINHKAAKISPKHTLDVVKNLVTTEEQIALPIDDNNIRSPWITGDKKTVLKLKRLVGGSQYRARKGVDTSLNAIFWVKVLETRGNLSLVQNCQTSSRSPVGQRTLWVESDTLYPVLRGKDSGRWNFNVKLYQILLYNKNTGKPLLDMEATSYPNAFKYFQIPEYKKLLSRRGIYTKLLVGSPIYACYDIGAYSFAKHKVVWKALASGMQAVVIESYKGKVIIPDHNVMMITTSDSNEAHYLCAILNSELVTQFVTSYIEWFYSTHILQYLKIPKWDANSKQHQDLAELSQEAHSLKDLAQTDTLQKNIDSIAETVMFHTH